MKIVHVIIANFYKEGFGYQENILPAKHLQLGYDVSIITQHVNNRKGPCEYVNDRGVRVVVLKQNDSFLARIKSLHVFVPKTKGLYSQLCKESPDIIFAHGINALDHKDLVKYIDKNENVKMYADNHSDYYNTPFYNSLKQRIINIFGLSRVIKNVITRAQIVWGVTPWRVKFEQEVFGVPKEKAKLLVMGGDETLIHYSEKESIRQKIRSTYNIPTKAFLIATGGKIDKAKNIHLLAEAIKRIENVYLIIFGTFQSDMTEFEKCFCDDKIIKVGWIPSDGCYDIFLASDFVVFPGTHSVLWEQACASGIPGIFKDWNGGFNHVDVGGNCILIKDISVESLYDTISKIVNTKALYNSMKEVAVKNAMSAFSYCNIAQKAIGLL